MTNETIERLLNLTSEEKCNGIYLSEDGELYIGGKGILTGFTGEYKRFWSNGQIHIHSHYKNGQLNGILRKFADNGTLLYRCKLYENGNMIKDYLK